jgi:probable HAF family extracellular repeat protein
MRRTPYVLLTIALAGCSTRPEVAEPIAPDAQLTLAQRKDGIEYRVTKLDALDGSFVRGSGLTSRGWGVGYASRATGALHAVFWRDGQVKDLGSLGGEARSSAVQWRGINDRGVVVGISYTSTPDTLGGTWSCKAFIPSTGTTCVGFVWEGGVMTALPTLGGDNGFATAVNNRGQVVGWAETATVDPTCDAPQRLGFRAVLWEPKKGRKEILRPLPGDSASAATAINGRGQVVGISGECDVAVGRFSAKRAVLWDGHGTPREIPNLGGEAWHTPMAINDRGDVVGFGNPLGGTGVAPALNGWVWTGGDRVVRIRPLAGHSSSQARGINVRRQVVGVSSGPAGSSAFLWENGVALDLNGLVAPSTDRLISAQDITNDGDIIGSMLEASTGRTIAYVATPVRRR